MQVTGWRYMKSTFSTTWPTDDENRVFHHVTEWRWKPRIPPRDRLMVNEIHVSPHVTDWRYMKSMFSPCDRLTVFLRDVIMNLFRVYPTSPKGVNTLITESFHVFLPMDSIREPSTFPKHPYRTDYYIAKMYAAFAQNRTFPLNDQIVARFSIISPTDFIWNPYPSPSMFYVTNWHYLKSHTHPSRDPLTGSIYIYIYMEPIWYAYHEWCYDNVTKTFKDYPKCYVLRLLYALALKSSIRGFCCYWCSVGVFWCP